ncbi:MAG: hypothetical protein ABIJ15_01755 [bacterium]
MPLINRTKDERKKNAHKRSGLADIYATTSVCTGWTIKIRLVKRAIFEFFKNKFIRKYTRIPFKACKRILIKRYPKGFNPHTE